MTLVLVFLASWWGAALLSLAIVLGGLVWGFISVYRPLRNVLTEIRKAKFVISNHLIPLHYDPVSDSVGEQLKDCPLLGKAWDGFKQSLVALDSVPVTAVYRRSVDAEVFFNVDNVLLARANPRLIHALPSIMTGFGILGTFVGLTAGIYLASRGLTANRLEDMRSALTQLLGGASTAFLTSLAGLSVSITLTLLTRAYLYRSEQALSQLATELNDKIPPIVPDQLAHEILQESRAQLAELKRFNTELRVSIEKALDEHLAARLVPKLDELMGVMEGLRKDRDLHNQESLVRLVTQFQQSLNEAAGKEITALVSAVRETRESLFQAQQTLSHEREGVSRSLAESLASFENGVTTVTEDLARVFEPLLGAVGRWSQAVQEATGLASSLMTAAGEAKAALGEAAASVRSGNKELQEGAAQVRAVLSEALEAHSLVKIVMEELMAAADRVEQSAGGFVQASEALQRHTQAVTASWESQRARFEGLDQDLKKAFAEMGSGIQGTLTQTAQVLGKANDGLADALKQLSGLVNELDEMVNDLIEHADGRLTKYAEPRRV